VYAKLRTRGEGGRTCKTGKIGDRKGGLTAMTMMAAKPTKTPTSWVVVAWIIGCAVSSSAIVCF
jgi:hypothetical protein